MLRSVPAPAEEQRAKREDGVSPLKVARRKLGVERGRRARYDRLVADDAPRYQPPAEVERMALPAALGAAVVRTVRRRLARSLHRGPSGTAHAAPRHRRRG